MLFGSRNERVLSAFKLSKSDCHIDNLLTKDNLRESGLLMSLPDPKDLHSMKEYFNLSSEGKPLPL